jgi:hypothetical protein
MLHIPNQKIQERSLLDRFIYSVNPHVGPLWIAIVVTILLIGGSYGIAHLMTSEEQPTTTVTTIESPVDIEGLLRSSISNVQKHGKLVVTSMDLQSTSSKEISGMVSSTAITTVSWAKVQYTMDLRKFDPNWISVKGTDILITIPQDYIQAEILGTNFKDIDNSGWWSTEEEKKKLHAENIKVNEAQMMTQANSMLEVVRPAAAQELKNMFSIPLKAVNLKFAVKVNVG